MAVPIAGVLSRVEFDDDSGERASAKLAKRSPGTLPAP